MTVAEAQRHKEVSVFTNLFLHNIFQNLIFQRKSHDHVQNPSGEIYLLIGRGQDSHDKGCDYWEVKNWDQ